MSHDHNSGAAGMAEDNWSGLTGFIDEVIFKQYLQAHPNPKAVEYYLCGPPVMIKACTQMLTTVGVPAHQIA